MRFGWALLRLSLVVSLALVFGSSFGCSAPLLKIQLPGFASGAVDGVWMWRLVSGSYQRVCRIDLSNPFFQGGAEIVQYQQTCTDGRPESAPWYAVVERLASNPSTVTLRLMFVRNGVPLPHKASSFNAYGESVLSTSTAEL